MHYALVALLLTSGFRDARIQEYIRLGDRTPRRMSVAAAGPLFEFAPASGAGVGTACACGAVTGSNGETMTFTRASDGTCLKNGTVSGIANGDMVTCSTDQPRIMPGGDGTGGLGLSVWEARTNVALRSEEFDNAAWTKLGSGTTTPVVTADQAVAPDGTTTADKVDLGATTGAQRSVLYQVPGLTVASSSSIFVKGVSGSGTMDVCTLSHCTPCAFVSTSWTRCADEGVTWSGGTSPFFGNTSNDNGGTARPAQSVYLWGAQYEAGARAGPYIKTAGVSATRATESAVFSVASAGAAKVSAAGTTVLPGVSKSVSTGFIWYKTDTTDDYLRASFDASSKLVCNFRIGGADNTRTSTAAATLSASNRAVCYYDLTNKADCLNATCETTAASLTLPSYTKVQLGATGTGSELNGVVKKVCLDITATGCAQ